MRKQSLDEVEVLRFFETESLDKVTVLFNIISDKMRARIQPENQERAEAVAGRKRGRRARILESAVRPPEQEESGGIALDSK